MTATEIVQSDPKLSSAQAAEYLGVAEATLAPWRCRGFGPKFLKLGRKVAYRKADLDRWLESRCVSFAAQLEG
ncbi:Helix-turn-helix domain protein [Caulifigura coniformis]|uniref:Helix-turn-helix domain protein n=1 Tax=Caulifigura coniformis TaxID=2527983 RepID=A0A517SMF5_9PLAN|nr:helix-turn-helix domain-containing protein [Caulifigura coniformis]QDT57310.1 Helix-turn-helix domain protein [Caulifigura coniformis]